MRYYMFLALGLLLTFCAAPDEEVNEEYKNRDKLSSALDKATQDLNLESDLEGLLVNNNIQLMDSAGTVIKFDMLKKPTLIYYFDSTSCSSCYRGASEALNERLKELTDKAYIVCSLDSFRDFKVLVNSMDIKFPIYFLSPDQSLFTPRTGFVYPSFFVMNEENEISHVCNKPKYYKTYLKKISSTLSNLL